MADVLPNAPLTEVVFEMRWSGTPPQEGLPIDPGYGLLLDKFRAAIRKRGFNRDQRMGGPVYFGHVPSVSERFYRGDAQFPILQLGHGIYAANESAGYEWRKFRELALFGARLVRENYPTLIDNPLKLSHLELRYIDVFPHTLLNTKTFEELVLKGTRVRTNVSEIWDVNGANRIIPARLTFHGVIEPSNKKVLIDLADARKDGDPLMRMETKVLETGGSLLNARSAKEFSTKLTRWIDEAHKVCSTSFKTIVSEEAYKKFAS